MILAPILEYNIQLNATKEFELPEESLVESLGRESSFEDIKARTCMLEKLTRNLRKNG